MAIASLCSVPDCGKPHHSNNFCRIHSRRWRDHGDPLGGKVGNGGPAAWLAEHSSHQGDDCLIWPFARLPSGYAKYQNTSGHRVMCEMVNGPAPSATDHAAHSCGRGPDGCVHPRHLRWASAKENAADRILHGTQYSGSTSPTAKLSPEAVEYIRSMKGKARQVDVGAEFGVGQSQVGRIQRGESWSD
jgi:hypothetical protein